MKLDTSLWGVLEENIQPVWVWHCPVWLTLLVYGNLSLSALCSHPVDAFQLQGSSAKTHKITHNTFRHEVTGKCATNREDGPDAHLHFPPSECTLQACACTSHPCCHSYRDLFKIPTDCCYTVCVVFFFFTVWKTRWTITWGESSLVLSVNVNHIWFHLLSCDTLVYPTFAATIKALAAKIKNIEGDLGLYQLEGAWKWIHLGTSVFFFPVEI